MNKLKLLLLLLFTGQLLCMDPNAGAGGYEGDGTDQSGKPNRLLSKDLTKKLYHTDTPSSIPIKPELHLQTKLPGDMLIEILEHCTNPSLARLAQTCKQFKALSMEVIQARLWSKLLAFIYSNTDQMPFFKIFINNRRSSEEYRKIEALKGLLQMDQEEESPIIVNHLFVCAIKTGNIDIIRALLATKYNFDPTCEDFISAVMEAIQKGYSEAVITLLQTNSIDINKHYSIPGFASGWTLLIRAASYGETEIVEALLKAGADISAVTPDGYTASKLAQLCGFNDIVKMLSSVSADRA